MAIVVIVIQTAMENPTAGIGAVTVPPAKATVLVAAVRAMGPVTGNLTGVKGRVTRGAKELSIAEAKVGAGILESPTAKTLI
jgi:hypothetical protein